MVYSIDNMWWYTHILGNVKCFHQKLELFDIFLYIENKNLLFKKVPLLEYEMYVKLNGTLVNEQNQLLFPLKFFKVNTSTQLNILDFSVINHVLLYNDTTFTLDSNVFYPRRLGFLTKKITMWYFLFILKIWHHLMLFYWWFLYLLKIYTQKKSSYVWLSASYFNVYCCFLLAILVYIYQYLPYLELYVKFKSRYSHPVFVRKMRFSIFTYLKNLITLKNSKIDIINILDQQNYSMTKKSVNYIQKYFY